MTVVSGLYAGSPRPLPPEGQQTGIFKTPVESTAIGVQGLVDDFQADRRFHGGPEKAVHQFAQRSYVELVASYPALRGIAVPGSIGENVSSADLAETNVCIGDCWRLGSVLLQVSQPRTPCWKIDSRFDVERLARHIDRQRICGWYYRVLEPGEVRVGDALELVDRPNADLSVDRFLQIVRQHRPDPDLLGPLIASVGLAPEWKQRLSDKQAFLRRRN